MLLIVLNFHIRLLNEVLRTSTEIKIRLLNYLLSSLGSSTLLLTQRFSHGSLIFRIGSMVIMDSWLVVGAWRDSSRLSRLCAFLLQRTKILCPGISSLWRCFENLRQPEISFHLFCLLSQFDHPCITKALLFMLHRTCCEAVSLSTPFLL